MALASWITALEGPREPQGRAVMVDGGAMRCTAEGQGPEMVLVHGLLGTAGHWQYAMPMLADKSRVYAVDALGMGESDRVPGLDTSLAAQADRLIAFLDNEQIYRADWVGTSYGAAVLLMLAARHPERVRSLTLHAPSNPFCGAADRLVRFYNTAPGRWFARQVPELPEWVQAAALARMYGTASEVRRGSLRRYIRSLRIPGTVDYILDVLAGWHTEMRALAAALPRIPDIPTLLLWGDDDRVVGYRSGQMLKESLRDAELYTLPGAGHLPHEEVPQAFAAAVNAFLRKRVRIASMVAPHLLPRRA